MLRKKLLDERAQGVMRGEEILKPFQDQLLEAARGMKIISVTLKKSSFGDNIHLRLERHDLLVLLLDDGLQVVDVGLQLPHARFKVRCGR
mgnify:CR=1 FL=1